MSLSKTLYPLLRTGSTKEDSKTRHNLKIVDQDVKNQIKLTMNVVVDRGLLLQNALGHSYTNLNCYGN